MLEGHGDRVISAVFSPDGRQILTASIDTTARLWQQADTGAWESVVLEGHKDSLTSAVFSPDGRQILTASWDKTARLWNIGWTVDDVARTRLNAQSGTGHMPMLVNAACKRLQSASAVIVDPGDGTAPRVRHDYTELDEADFEAVPLLRSAGFKPGDDVCDTRAPTGLDAVLTKLIPRRFWSGLDWSR